MPNFYSKHVSKLKYRAHGLTVETVYILLDHPSVTIFINGVYGCQKNIIA